MVCAGRLGTVIAILSAEVWTSPAKGHVSHSGFESAASGLGLCAASWRHEADEELSSMALG